MISIQRSTVLLETIKTCSGLSGGKGVLPPVHFFLNKKIPNKSSNIKATVDFRIFLVYNAIMKSQVFVIIDPQTVKPVYSRSKT
jgi:hypothetical protein